jgi:hypothetical protein
MMSPRHAAAAALAVLLAAGGAALAKPPVTATPFPGSLVLQCNTEGAEVFVDGKQVGVTPLAPLPLPPGEHTIKVQKLGFAPLIDVFTINKRKESKVEVEMVPISAVLRVTSNVEQAHVFVDGKFVGEAPLTVEVAVGERAVQVSKGGFKDFFQNLSAVAGQELSLEVSLEELPIGVNPYKPAPPPPPKWYEKWWVWTAAAGGVVVVVTAIAIPVALTRTGTFGAGADYSFSTIVPSPPK